MIIRVHSFELPHRHTFRIARESKNTQRTFIVELDDGRHQGFGESAEDPYYHATTERMLAAIQSVQEIIAQADPDQPEQLWASVAPQLLACPFALNALDIAAHDLAAKRAGVKLYEKWGYAIDANVHSNYTIGIDEIPKMIEKMHEFPEMEIYKIKLGTDQDVEIVRALRQHTQARFRVDANCGWGERECLENARQLVDLGVEFIEQPLSAHEWASVQRVYEQSPLPLMADESCITENDVQSCAGHFHGINIKLCKCGGLTPARRMITEAKELGLKVMVGCMTETSVGISAIAHLLPALDYVDMDGALLLAEDVAAGATVTETGACVYASTAGTGVELRRQNVIYQYGS